MNSQILTNCWTLLLISPFKKRGGTRVMPLDSQRNGRGAIALSTLVPAMAPRFAPIMAGIRIAQQHGSNDE